LAEHYHIEHLSSGELLRGNAAAGTSIGQTASDYLTRGDLVPDDLVVEVLTAPLLDATHSGGFVLDGFPRSVHQAEMLEQMLEQIHSVGLQAVLHLKVVRDELLRRLLERATREGRSDDDSATVAHRLEVFDAETASLIGFYTERGLVIEIDGERPVDEVFADIVSSVDRRLGGRSRSS
jgi:adenylate kinase